MPLAASALPPQANNILSGSLRTLRGAGFAGLDAVESVPTPVAIPAARAAAAATSDDSQVALTALIQAAEAQSESIGFIPEEAVALGFQKDILARSLGKQSTADTFRHFQIAKYQGETVIVFAVFSKAAKELRSYRTSATGILEAAVVTTKSNGVYHAATISLPNSDVTADFQEQVRFWTQYYNDHLKH